MLGFSFDKSGLYLGWSDIFDYSSLEAIDASERLPLPSGKTYRVVNEDSKVANLYIDFSDINGHNPVLIMLNETNPIKKMLYLAKILYRLLKDTDRLGLIRLSKLTKELQQQFLDLVNKHEATKFGKNSDNILKNFIASNILYLILKTGNLPQSYSPVEMDALKEPLPYAPKLKNATKLTLYNPATVPVMQETNMTGKSGTGIAANGLKGLFMWRFDTLEALKNGTDVDKNEVTFDITIDRVNGRFAHERALEQGILDELKPVTLTSLPDLGEVANHLQTLNPLIKSDNIGSLYISAATDNAKELILAIINAGNNLMKCHLYLVSLGFDVQDIVAFMTSPVISLIDGLPLTNIFTGLNIKLSDVISFVQKYLITLKILQNENNPEEREKLNNDLSSMKIKGVRSIIVETFKQRLQSLEDREGALADVNSLSNILEGAEEFSTLGRTLSINQGVPLTKEELNAFKKKLALIVSSRLKKYLHLKKTENGTIEYIDKLVIFLYFKNEGRNFIKKNANGKLSIDKKLAIEYYNNSELKIDDVENLLREEFDVLFNDCINFNADRWLNDKDYRYKVSAFYNLIKHTINVFHVVEHVAHYSAMFDIANILNNLDKKVSIKSLLSNHFNTLLRELFPYAPLDTEDKLLASLDEVLIGHYLKTSGIKIPLKNNWKVLDSYCNIIDNTGNLLLMNDSDISSYKYIFETYIIPELQQGILLDNIDANNAILNNEFILSLLSTDDNGVPMYRVDIDLMSKNNNDQVRLKFFRLIEALNELKQYSFKGVPVSDLFILYNIIVNKNKYGAKRMTELFEDFIIESDDIDNNLLFNYLKTLGEIDFPVKNTEKNETVETLKRTVTLTDLLCKIAPTVNPDYISSYNNPIIKTRDKNGKYIYVKKIGRNNYDMNHPIMLLLQDDKETNEAFIARQIRFDEFGFGLPYAESVINIVNLLTSDNYLLTFNNLIQNSVIKITIDCGK